jgi:putative ABC transport system permease protein
MQIYLPEAQFPTSFMTLVVHTSGDPLRLIAAVRNTVYEMDKDQAVYNIATMEQLLAESISLRRFSMLLLMTFAGVALLLAGIGIYGVISYSVAQRTQEIGIRMALGARATDVLRLVLGQFMRLTVLGVAVGLVAAYLLTRLMASLLFGVTATDVTTFVLVPISLLLVALVACLIPARRATRVDPLVALRYE